MKLDGPFRIVLSGDTSKFAAGSRTSDGFPYLLERLLSGMEAEVGEINLRPYGLTIERLDPGSAAGLEAIRALTPDDMEAVWERAYVGLPLIDNEAALELVQATLDTFVAPRECEE